jgi:heterogeneous nuclear ribonucleoprotein L
LTIFDSHFQPTLLITNIASFVSAAPLLGPGAPGFNFVPSPEYPVSNGVPLPTPGPPSTPIIAQEPWKPAPATPQTLMKEPPLAANRNATTAQFPAQNQQQAAVMMVYGLDTQTSNTDKLFNLVCLYGE